MKRKMFGLSVALLFATTVCAEEPLARSTPPGAVAYLELDSLEPLYQQLPVDDWMKAVEGNPQYQKFRASANYERMQTGKAFVELYMGMDFPTLANKLLATRTAVAVYPAGEGKQPDGFVLVRFADRALWTKIRTNAEALLALFAGGRMDRSLHVDGRAVTTIDGKFFYFTDADQLVVASSKELIKSASMLLAHRSEKSLADDATFKNADRNLAGTNLGRFFVNTQQIRVAMKGKRWAPQKLDNALGTLLLQDGFELAATCDAIGAGLEARHKQFALTFSIAGAPDRLGEAFQGFFLNPLKAGSPALPDVKGYLGGLTIHRDLSNLYRQREKLLIEGVQPDFDKFESGLNNLLPGKSFGEDVLPMFGSQLTFVAARQDYATLGGKPALKLPAFAMIIETAQAKEAADAIQLIFQAIVPILNLQAKQNGSQPQLMRSELYRDTPIQYARYLTPPKGDALPVVYNFQPASAAIGKQVILASSLQLCRDLVDHFKNPSVRLADGRNLVFTVIPGTMAEILKDNGDSFVASQLREGKTAGQAKDNFGFAVKALQTVEAIHLATKVQATDFQIRVEVKLK